MKIISEIGINHNGDFRKMEELIRQSSIGGADYAKFQVYDSQKVFGDDSRAHNEFTYDELAITAEMCDVYGIEFMASVFDIEKFEWCEDLKMKSYKIASRTIANLLDKDDKHLIESIIKTGKPVIISLGMWEGNTLPYSAYPNVRYMNCISNYPTMYQHFKRFQYDTKKVGYSDHACGISYALFNIAEGASIIEKHFTLNKGMDGNDHIGSMDVNELKLLREYGQELCTINAILPDREISINDVISKSKF